MRLVAVSGLVVELNYMWLPTWIGQNAQFKQKLETDLRSQIEGLELTESNLDKIDRMVLDYIVAQHTHVEGLFDYLDGLKFVRLVDKSGG
jgi:hypothetical protein